MSNNQDENRTALIKLDSFSEFQQRLHYPDTEDEHIPSPYYIERNKTSWNVEVLAPLSHSSESDFSVYTASSKLDYLLYTYLVANLSQVKVKREWLGLVEICYCYNPGHNIIEITKLCFNKNTASGFNNTWLDNQSQSYMKSGAGFEGLYNYMIGNVPALLDWNSNLPNFTLVCPQPWYYSEARQLAVPLFLLSSLSHLTHFFHF